MAAGEAVSFQSCSPSSKLDGVRSLRGGKFG